MMMGITISLTGRLLSGAFSPAILFQSNEPGFWYDPSDVANLNWRRNLLTWTEQFDNAAWVKSGLGVALAPTVTANFALSPLGDVSAERVQFSLNGGTTSTDQSLLRQTVSGLSTVDAFAFSFYARATDGVSSYAMIAFGKPSASQSITVTGQWQRFVVSGAGANTNYSLMLRGGQTPTNSNTADILIWGAQLEVGSVATEYQPITTVDAETIARFPTATLYRDTAGTQPVTTPGDTVALMLDKSQGLVLGPELVTNGDFSNGTTGWAAHNSASISVVSGKLRVAGNGFGVFPFANQAVTTVVGRTYLFTADASFVSGSDNNVLLQKSDNSGSAAINNATGPFCPGGPLRLIFTATATTSYIRLMSSDANDTYDWGNVSVRELPGFHATQSTTANRPTYGIVPKTGRRNLLTYTEQFDNAAWTKTRSSITSDTIIAPDGTLTGDKLVEGTDSSTTFVMSRNSISFSAGFHTFSAYVKEAGRTFIQLRYVGAAVRYVEYDLSTNSIYWRTAQGTATASILDVGNGWKKIIFTNDMPSGISSLTLFLGNGLGSVNYTGDGTSGIFIWGAQLELGSTATSYQRVTTQFDVTEAGVASDHYLFFGGSTDPRWMVTPTITPGIDKVQVFAGVRKLSDSAAYQVIVEHSPSLAANNGAFVLAPAVGTYEMFSKGTTQTSASGSGFPAPITNVVTGLGDIAGDLAALRVNGTQVAQSTADQGTGNYLAYPAYIGARGGSFLHFNGQIFQLITRFGPNLPTPTIQQTERFVAEKTAGVTL